MKIAFAFCILFLSLTMHAQESLTGVWNMGQDNTKIKITEGKGIYEGRIASSDNADVKIGNLILKEVKLVDGKWKGKMYAPKKQEWFDAILKVEGKQLLVTVKSGWASQTLKWSKE
ncbi:MAG: hypothetical protein HC892_21525 [Saprospiraceae bacterium]|nr:hypothetical protein [Saprospiraceae bacterium]